MRRKFLLGFSTVSLLSIFTSTECKAFDDSWAMTPELFRQHMQSEDNFNDQMLRMMSEELRNRRQNPYYNCQFISMVEGNNADDARQLAISLGATHLQLKLVTSTHTTGAAYKCP